MLDDVTHYLNNENLVEAANSLANVALNVKCQISLVGAKTTRFSATRNYGLL